MALSLQEIRELKAMRKEADNIIILAEKKLEENLTDATKKEIKLALETLIIFRDSENVTSITKAIEGVKIVIDSKLIEKRNEAEILLTQVQKLMDGNQLSEAQKEILAKEANKLNKLLKDCNNIAAIDAAITEVKAAMDVTLFKKRNEADNLIVLAKKTLQEKELNKTKNTSKKAVLEHALANLISAQNGSDVAAINLAIQNVKKAIPENNGCLKILLWVIVIFIVIMLISNSNSISTWFNDLFNTKVEQSTHTNSETSGIENPKQNKSRETPKPQKTDPFVPAGITATYGQTLSQVSLPTGWSWVTAETTSVGNIGKNTFKAKYKGSDKYKAISNVDIIVLVKQKIITDYSKEVELAMSNAINAYNNGNWDDAYKYYTEAASYPTDRSSSIKQTASQKFLTKAKTIISNNNGKCDDFSKKLLQYANNLYPSSEIQDLLNKCGETTSGGVSSNSGRFPQGSRQLLSYSDLSGLSKYDLKIMRNEIFARHGYIFTTNDMINYFKNQSWYTPRYSDVTSMLTNIEQKNIALIKQYE